MGGGGGGMGGPAVGILVVAAGLMMVLVGRRAVEGATWCIARSAASATALQAALDFVCGTKADCLPIQASGLCYLPNTLPSHASYAFNSYYQRSNAAPGSCDFAGAAAVSVTDPSYGSCTYPSSPSTAGGSTSNTPNFSTPTNTPGIGGTGGGIGGLSPPGVRNYDTSYASPLLNLFLSTCIGIIQLLL